MFSKTCEYAIRALIYVALETIGNESKIGIKQIAEQIDAPIHFISKILQELSKKNFIQSLKGPKGGFYIEDVNYSIADVVREIDGDRVFSSCALGLNECNEKYPCPLHFQFSIIRKKMRDLLENSNILEFAENVESHRAFLRN